MVTESLLNIKANFFVDHLWGRKLTIPVKVNNRLKSVLGRCRREQIEISKLILNDELLTDDVLLHELCHWYCREIGEEYKDHTKYFEDELQKIGASSTFTSTYISGSWLHLYNYGCYECKICKREMETKDYLKEKVVGDVGTFFKEYNCCGVKMRYSGRKPVAEKFVENDKLNEIRSAFRANEI